MKKILYVAMAALVLMACNSNEPKVVSKDKKALIEVTKSASSLIGQPIATADAKLLKLGYVDMTDQIHMPARLAPRKLKAEEEGGSRVYYYNVSSIDDFETEEKSIACMNSVIEAKKLLIMAQVGFDEKENVTFIMMQYIGGQEIDNIHNLYLNAEKHLYGALVDNVVWGAVVAEADDMENFKEFTDHAKFETAFEELALPVVEEEGQGVDKNKVALVLEGAYAGEGSLLVGLDVKPCVSGMLAFGLAEMFE